MAIHCKEKLAIDIINGWSFVTEEQALAIAEYIMAEIHEDEIYDFIDNDLVVYKNKKQAFDWFFDYEREGKVPKDNVDVDITEDMVGKNLRDIMLDNQENYKEIAGLYLVWWL